MQPRILAEQHHDVHKDCSFFPELIEFIISCLFVGMVWEGDGVIADARKLFGALKTLKSESGIICGDLAINIDLNVIHGSDSSETAEIEITLWFTSSDQVWRVESKLNFNPVIANWA